MIANKAEMSLGLSDKPAVVNFLGEKGSLDNVKTQEYRSKSHNVSDISCLEHISLKHVYLFFCMFTMFTTSLCCYPRRRRSIVQDCPIISL